MTEDYYEPYPKIALSRPIVLGGQLGCGARQTGRGVCARRGLPFVDVDRQIEHEAGRSLVEIASNEGPKRLRTWARSVLERQVIERPMALIVLDHAWPAIETGALLRRKVDFVHLSRPTGEARRRIHREIDRVGAWMLDPCADGETMDSVVDRAFSMREPLLEQAGILLEAGSQHAHSMAGILLESLEPVLDARTL